MCEARVDGLAARRERLLAEGALRGPHSAALGLTLPVACVCWLLMLVIPHVDWVMPLCTPAAAGTIGSFAANLDAQLSFADPLLWLGDWAIMVGAMMLPLAIPPLHFLARRSFARLRVELLFWWLAAFGAAWAAAAVFGTVAILFARAGGALLPSPGLSPLLCYLGASLWQISALKRRALALCHEAPVLRSIGMAARIDAATFGFVYGLRCARTCLPVMALGMADGPGAASTFCVFGILLAERNASQPDRAYMMRTAIMLLVLGAAKAAGTS